MSSCSRWLAILLVPTVLAAVRANADVQWFRDLDEAKAIAGRQKKDLLINFTGSSWCGACLDLKHDVLEQPGFAPAAESFVLVELEFPQSSAELPDEFREKYLAWRDHYGIRSYPTVLLADQQGKVYAVTGHIGVGAEEYIAHIEELQRNRESLKENLAKATKAEGLEKARRLDDALSIFRRSCVERKDESNGNPLIRFYRSEIEEIIALDAENEAGLREKYRGILAAQQEKDRVRSIYAQLHAVGAEKGFAAAVEFLDTKISEEKSPKVRKRFKRSRLTYLEWSDCHEEAIAYAAILAEDEGYSATERRDIRSRIAFNLRNLRRFDEALMVYDDLLNEVAGDRRTTADLLESKTAVYEMAGRFDEAANTWEMIRALDNWPAGSSRWLDVEILCSRAMVKAGHHVDAASILRGVLDTKTLLPNDRAIALVELAIVLSHLDRHKEARDKADEAERIAKSEEVRRRDPDLLPFVLTRIEQMVKPRPSNGKQASDATKDE